MAGKRFLTLDAMRGLAALAVVSIHFANAFTGPSARYGFLAVDAFFVLSGFVLALAYDGKLSSGELTFLGFMRRRVVRLAPLYLLGLALGLMALLVRPDPALAGARLWVAFAFNAVALPSPFPAVNGNMFPLDNPFWSLFFELWVANLAFGLFWRWLKGPVLIGVILVSAAGLTGYAISAGSLAAGWNYPTLWVGFCRVGFSFFAGVWVARRFRQHPPRFSVPAPLLLAGLAAALLVPLGGRLGEASQLASIFLVFPALTYHGAAATHLPERAGRMLGDASYAAYTIHFPLLRLSAAFFGGLIHQHRTPAQIAFLAFILPLSWVAAKGDEWVRRPIGSARPGARPGPLSSTSART